METLVKSWLHLNLRILPLGARALAIAAGLGAVFGIYMGIADALLFRSAIPSFQSALVSNLSAVDRIVYFTPIVVIEEIEFRLVSMSLLVWILTTMAGRRAWCFWASILITAFLIYPAMHQAYLSELSPTLLHVTREILLHGSAGVLWGYLYWRYGLIAAMIGHISAHVSLEPLLSRFFA